jgi:hypothetical protein
MTSRRQPSTTTSGRPCRRGRLFSVFRLSPSGRRGVVVRR